jgi:hypothetical protein
MSPGFCAVSLPVAFLLALSSANAPLATHQQNTGKQTVRTEGKYVASAYNDEGYVIVGYRLAGESIGADWMLLEVGTTVREGIREFTLKPEAISLVTPPQQRIAMATLSEFRAADLRALEMRADVVRDSINYFPHTATTPCWLNFFSDQASRTRAWPEATLTSSQACRGRIYFRVPGGITEGTYRLEVQFATSRVSVPFTIGHTEDL